jgi:hypothetical protein
MTAALNKIAEGDGALGKEIVYGVTFTSTYPVAGEPINISADFKEIITARVDYANDIADHSIKFDIVGPADGTDVSSSNVLLVGHRDSGSAGNLAALTNAFDLTGFTELRVHVIGKPLNNANFKG